jgi:hypothetical protein
MSSQGPYSQGYRKRTITIIQSGRAEQLVSDSENIVTVAAKDAIIVVLNSPTEVVELDGAPVRGVRQSGDLLLSLDLTRSVGFHLLRVSESTFLFATDDGKSRLAGIVDMLKAIQESGLSWGNQLFFADGSSLSDERLVFAWLWRWLATIAQEVEAVARAPRATENLRTRTASHLDGRLQVGKTLALLRRHHELLEPRSNGTISAAGRTFVPRLVAVRDRKRTIVTKANRRVLAVASRCLQLTSLLLSGGARVEHLRVFVPRLRDAIRSPGLAPSARLPLPELSATREERTDPRYVLLYERFLDLRRLGCADLGKAQSSLIAFVRHSDEIYQAYVATTLAEAFGCKLTAESLVPRLPKAAFEGERYSIFYDTAAHGMRTWRAETSRPDDARPDVVIVDKQEHSFLIVDAKYRRDGNAVSLDSLREVQYYLNSFLSTAAVIAYPPADPSYRGITVHSGHDQSLCELPIAPREDTVAFLIAQALPVLIGLFRRQTSGGTVPPTSCS